MADSSEHITGELARVLLDDNDENPTADAENRIADALCACVRDGDVLWPGEAYLHLFPLSLTGITALEYMPTPEQYARKLMPILEQYAYRTMEYIFAHIFPRCGVNVVSADEIPPNLVTPPSPADYQFRVYRPGVNCSRECGRQLMIEDEPRWDLRKVQNRVCKMCHLIATKVMHNYALEHPNKRFVEAVDVRWGYNSNACESGMAVSCKSFGQYYPVKTNDSHDK